MIAGKINGSYLSPDYDKDDEDDDDLIDEEIDEDGEDGITENFLDNQENLKNSKPMVTTPFGGNSSPTPTPSWGQPQQNPIWGSGNNNNSSPWSNTQNNGSIWGSSGNSSTWNSSNRAWGSSWNSSPNWGSSSEKKEINREKKVIICDVLDCLVETYQSGGRPGLLPRGIYDIKFRFDVWDKIACFNPEKIFAMVPISLINCSNGINSCKVLLEYIICSLSEYLKIPYQVCQVLLQTEIGQSKEELIKLGLSGIPKEDVICLGINSGMYGQNNRDQLAAKNCGVDYIDLATFLNSYY